MTRITTASTLSPLAATSRLPLIAQFAVLVATVITQWDHRYRSRNQLKYLEDHMLEDIGLTRAQAMKESKRPFWRA